MEKIPYEYGPLHQHRDTRKSHVVYFSKKLEVQYLSLEVHSFLESGKITNKLTWLQWKKQ